MFMAKMAGPQSPVSARECSASLRNRPLHRLSAYLLHYPLTALEPGGPSVPRIGVGSCVELFDAQDREICSVIVVCPDEASPEQGQISSASPLGQTLIGKAVGCTVSVSVFGAPLHFTVLGVR